MITRRAHSADIQTIVNLVNSAYRGESSKRGWTTEAALLDGQRVDAAMIEEMVLHPHAGIWVVEKNGELAGCMYLEKKANALYLGMLTVKPDFQAAGLGSLMLARAEELAIEWNLRKVEMTVITLRTELVNWYLRKGYRQTGKIKDFPQDKKFGIPKVDSLKMETLEKNISSPNTSAGDIAIDIVDLGRTYKSYQKQEGVWSSLTALWNRKHIEVPALKPTTLSISSGQIVGLIGANGAGKTTLLKTLSGLIHPTSGDAKILGFRPWERKNDFLRQISLLLGQKNQLWWDISPADSFELLTKIYDIDRATARQRVKNLSEILNCAHVLNIQLRRLSLGERMKMEIIGALLHEPRVLFLDEPTIGLDIVAQSSIRKFLENYVKEKKPTIILTSHYMDDIAELADRLLLMSKGSVVYDGSVEEFTKKSQSANLNSTDQEADFESVIHQFLEKESRV